MKYLAAERLTVNHFIPGLDEELTGRPLLEMEREGSGIIAAFKNRGGCGLLVPKTYSGLGATSIEAIKIQRALGSRSPSLAVAVCMHNFSVASLVELCKISDGMEFLLLEGIARNNLLVASGFAEGRKEQGILVPTMTAKKAGNGYVITGNKKPCSLSQSMDLLTASVRFSEDPSNETPEIAVALIPAAKDGVEVKEFWGSWILAGAESHEVCLNEVFIESQLIFPITKSGQLDQVQLVGLVWFELLICASYLGIVSGLVEKVIRYGRGTHAEVTELATETESAMAALETIALALNREERIDEALLAKTLFVRYAVTRSIDRAACLSCELLGGMAFIGSSDVSYLYAASKALSFHPPSRPGISLDLAGYLSGESLNIK